MAVRVQLDKAHDYFTNLDHITGQIILFLQSSEAITSITVKLEGESKTRLADEINRKRAELEVHKLLYKAVEVFPSQEIKQQTFNSASYTLPPGQHSYPFQFKLPFNNNCSTSNSLYNNLNFAGMRVELARDTDKHVKKSLPPSLSGFPGEAEIRYYVKVTVARPEFYKENHRAHSDFKFFPIEPPRPPRNNEEAYARRQHEFPSLPAPIPRKKSFFEQLKKNESPVDAGPPPKLTIDARLPNPSIITCNEALPLRLILSTQSEYTETIFLTSLHLELVGYTHVRAHELGRTESASWVIQSYSNLSIPLEEPRGGAKPEIVVDDSLWKNVRLPNTVAPTFETCNLSRTYELDVRVGLGYGTLTTFRNRVIVLPLRMPVQVFSGIAPPPALLEAIASQDPATLPTNNLQPPMPERPPITPTTPTYTSYPAQAGAPGPSGMAFPSAEEAPPSYEDAMAEQIGPVDGMRRDYDMSPQTTAEGASSGDEKTPGGFRRDSERLFPESAAPAIGVPDSTTTSASRRAFSTRKPSNPP